MTDEKQKERMIAMELRQSKSLALEKFKWLLIAFALLWAYQMGMLIEGFYIGIAMVSEGTIPLVAHLIVSVINILCLVFFFYFAHKQGYLARLRDWLTIKNLAIILLGYLFIIGYDYVLSLFATEGTTANQQAIESYMAYIPKPVYIPMLVISAPVCEEIIFRGIIFKNLCPKNLPLAYLISTLTFAALHMPTDLMSWCVYGGMGALFCLVYHLSKRLEVAIGLHLLNNLVATLIMFWG